jgi:hypothetical protein
MKRGKTMQYDIADSLTHWIVRDKWGGVVCVTRGITNVERDTVKRLVWQANQYHELMTKGEKP